MHVLSIPKKLVGWTEISTVKAILRQYSIFLSPDEKKTAVLSLEDGAIVSIYDRVGDRLEYVSPQLVEGMNLIHESLPVLRSESGADLIRDLGDLREGVIKALVKSGVKCAHCGIHYIDIGDFVERNPRRGHNSDLLVDSFCWEAYNEAKKAILR